MIKRFFLFACLLMASVYVRAQISVVSFKYLENDNDANTFGQIKKDQNGDKAALIKIVTPITDLSFDLGQMEQVECIPKPGEIWLYIQRRSTKISIISPKFGKLTDYKFNMSIDGGRTYEMLLDVGTGRFVTITTAPRTNSDVTIDGEYIGKSPIYNRYLNFGPHTIYAKNDRWEGTDTLEVLPKDSKTNNYHAVKMRNMSDHFGDVTVNVEKDAEIYFENRLVGTGSWKTELREGSYFVETKKPDCDSARTNFTVVAQKKNEIQAAPPTPHTGYLRLVTHPSDAEALYFGTRHLSVEDPNVLPVGTYEVNFMKKGYENKVMEYTVTRNETTTDTVWLDRIKYVAPTTFYFGVGASLRSMTGITGFIGGVIKNHDFQAHYTFGLSSSDPVYIYTAGETSNEYQSAISFKQSSFGLKYGYQLVLNDKMNKLAFTPQVGVCVDRLTSTLQDGTNLYADGASATCVSVGAKLLYAPVQHFYMFLAPEYDIAVQKDENFQKLADAGSISAGGFQVQLGLIVNF